MRTIPNEFKQAYIDKTKELIHRRTFLILWIGIIIIPLLSILDYVVTRQYFTLFLFYRMTCSITFVFLLLLLHLQSGKSHAFHIAMSAYIIASSFFSLICVQMGVFQPFYYVGIIMLLVAFTAILPLNVSQAVISGVIIFSIYLIPVIIVLNPSGDELKIFFNNGFFFVFFIFITTLQCYEETKGRIREFRLKTEMDVLAERLSYYAHNLKVEVDKRVKDLEESEIKYRELYENIVDIVMLVDRNSKILMANPRFYEIIGIPNGNKINFSFMNLVKTSDTALVEHMLIRLPVEQSVKDFQFRIANRQDRIFDVECNAKCIYKKNDLIGFQMVIRDITVRKRLEQDLLESYKKVQSARNATILGLAKLAEYRDADTGAHLERIREYSKVIAEELSIRPGYEDYISKKYIDDIYNSSILHDIGKVGIPDSILLKPGRLSKDEFDVVKRHSALGGDALKAVESRLEGKSFLSLGKEIAYYHHERWDGTGYPKGLSGEDIPLSARIVSLADVYDALTSKRVYKEAYSHETALEIIVREAGKQFDPDVVDAFMEHEDDFRRIREEMFREQEKADREQSIGLA